MDGDKLVDVAIACINTMSDIIDIYLDNVKYDTKEEAYDAVAAILVENDILSKMSELGE